MSEPLASTFDLDLTPATGGLGVTVNDIDLSGELGDDQIAALRAAMHAYGVLFFRDQMLSEEQHIAFAERWGEININRFFKKVDGFPKIAQVRKDPDQKTNIGGGWHADHSYDDAPAMGSILYALEVPPVGGDTMFANMMAAYDALSDGLKETLDGLRALHSTRHVFGPANPRVAAQLAKKVDDDRLGNAEAATQEAVHPVVIRHPESGRKVLYVNPGFTVQFDGWTQEESQPLLDFLYRHATRPELTCRFQWEKGSVAFWDNRSTWHYAVNDYHGHARLMHRITLEGVEVKA